jgi:phospholipase/lecithinase/hemolysin
MRHFVWASVAAATMLATPASATSIGKIYAFGDSLNDCCRNPGAPFNNGDETWLPAFADAVGGDYSEDEAHNYAVGGAQAGPVNAVPATDTGLGYLTGFTSQAARFRDIAPASGTHDLGVLWVATNDIWASALQGDLLFGAVPFNRPAGKQPTVSAFVEQTVDTIRSGIADLKAGGIDKLLILTPYDMSQAALWDTAEARALNKSYSFALRDELLTLHTSGLDTWVLDMIGVLSRAQADFPNKTGLEPCPTPATAGACDDYVFNDFVHLTDRMNAIVAAEAAMLVNTGVTVAPIPLPAPVALLATGLASLLVIRRQKAS